jgi:atypical dual specificity phosphatase
LHQLAKLGVSAVVNLCEEFPGHERELGALGMIQLCLPTLDYHAPAEESILTGIEFIQEHAGRGQKVYVHCKAGRGRSATLVLCYLMVTRRWTPEQAYRHIKTARPQVDGGLERREVVKTVHRRVQSGELD